MRNFKVIGIALVMAFAANAVAVSGAQAATPTIVAGAIGTYSGEQVGTAELTYGNRALNCKVARAVGPTQTSQISLTIVPEYRECSTTPVLGVSFSLTVTMNGCDYLATNLKHTETAYTGDVSVICPPGKKVELHLYTNQTENSEVCTMTVEEDQTDVSGTTITNVAGSPDDLLLHVSMRTTIEKHGSILCGSETGTAELHGTGTARAFDETGKQVSLTAITDA